MNSFVRNLLSSNAPRLSLIAITGARFQVKNVDKNSLFTLIFLFAASTAQVTCHFY